MGVGGITGVEKLRDEVARAWHRVLLTGLRPDAAPGRAGPAIPSPAEPPDAPPRLVEAATPILRDLAERLAGSELSILVADREHRVVSEWIRTPMLGAAFGVTEAGACVAESVIGNNVLATPAETGRETWIHGSEHYLERLRPFSGYGLPVRHPLTRHVEGAIAMLARAPRADPLFGPVITRAARDVEARLLDSARAADRRLFAAFQQVARRRSVPVAVTGGDVVLANRAFTDAMGTTDPSLLRALLPEIPQRGRLVRAVDLGAQGRIPVVAERVDGTTDGVLYRLGERVRRAAATPASTGRASSVLVAGEPGTGRTRAALRAAGEGVVTVDALAAVGADEREWAAELLRVVGRHSGAVVVEEAHLLPELACTVVRRVMDAGRARVVLTTCPVDELPPAAARLAGRCVERVELAPLRERLDELPALLASMGVQVRPDRSWTLTPRAGQALCAHPWDGNLVELAVLVDELSARPCAGRVDLDDLPARYRPTGRASRLGGRERAERLAIMGALRSSAGNKRRAAAQLGISRTTLYRRMHALDIPDRVAG